MLPLVLKPLTSQLARGKHLSEEQVVCAVAALVDEKVSVEIKASFLTALARKGETVEEIAVFARGLRDKSVAPPIEAKTRKKGILDVCGTGGDKLDTFNISTTVAIVVAAGGVAVAKHGNRAITSKSGSADVLEALGIRTDLSPREAAQSLAERNFAFFFAPNYHPAFKHIGPARKLCAERKQRTIFNFLGPLLNPARPTAQLIGVPRPELCIPMAKVLQRLGVRRGMVVSGCPQIMFPYEEDNRVQKVIVLDMQFKSLGIMTVAQAFKLAKAEGYGLFTGKSNLPLPIACFADFHTLFKEPKNLRKEEPTYESPPFLDEFSIMDDTFIAEFERKRAVSTSILSARNLDLQRGTIEDLKGGDSKENAEIIRRILKGDERGPKREAVLLNAAAALVVANKSKSIEAGMELAAELIDSGRAMAKLKDLAKG